MAIRRSKARPQSMYTQYNAPSTDDILHSYGNLHYETQEPWQNFDRYYTFNPMLDDISTAKQYVFFVRPECNIYVENAGSTLTDELQNDPFFVWMHQYHRVILGGLSMNFSTNHDFIPFLTGRVESLQIPDYGLKVYNALQPYTHYSLPYGGSAVESQTGGVFDVTFRDSNTFILHKFFQAWIYYIDGVVRNKFSPFHRYMMYNKLDYATSVYHFICAHDGETVLWWGKYTGCFPQTITNSDLSWNKGGTFDGKFSVPFNYYYFESLNPEIINDFNYNAKAGKASGVTGYNEDILGSGMTYVGAPFITTLGDNLRMYLKWREPIGSGEYF